MNETSTKSKNPNFEEARTHFRTARHEMKQSIKSLFPSSFFERRRAARKEFLLGIRKLVDAAIDHVDQA